MVGFQARNTSQRTYILNFKFASNAADVRETFELEDCEVIDVTAEHEEKYKKYYLKGEAGTLEVTALTFRAYSLIATWSCSFFSLVSFEERYYGLSRTDAYGSYTKPGHYGWYKFTPRYVLRFWSYEFQCEAMAECRRARRTRREREAAKYAAALKRIEMRAAAAATAQPEANASASSVVPTPNQQRAAEAKEESPTTELDAWHADAVVRLKAPRRKGVSFPLGDFPIGHFPSLRSIFQRFVTLAMPKESAPLKLNTAVSVRSREVGGV